MRRDREDVFSEANLLIANALVNVNGDNLLTSAGAVTQMTNLGTGGADYDLDVVLGTGANLKPSPSGAVLLYGASGDYCSTPDSVAASITGDIDIRVKVSADDWTPSVARVTVGKWTTSNLSYLLRVEATTGVIKLFVSEDGSAIVSATSSVAPSVSDGGTIWLRATLDISTDAVIFYTSDDGATWVQLGTGQSLSSSISSIFDGNSSVEIGSASGGTGNNWFGSIYIAEIYNGIDGTLAVDFDARDQTDPDGTTFTSSGTGETWTQNGNAFIQNTNHTVVHSIGSAGLETTAGQLIANPYTVFVVCRFSTALTADQFLLDSRSSASNIFIMFANDPGDLFSMNAGSTLGSVAYDNDPHVITMSPLGATDSFITIDSSKATGDAGNNDWDFGTILASRSGTATAPGYFAEMLVFDYQLSETQVSILETHLANRNSL